MEESPMLVLTRKTDESIFIDGDIEVMVVAVRGSKVRLGFRAPANISIQRKERVTDESDEVGVHVGAPEPQRHAKPTGLSLAAGRARSFPR
jgi:carbon storage regulator